MDIYSGQCAECTGYRYPRLEVYANLRNATYEPSLGETKDDGDGVPDKYVKHVGKNSLFVDLFVMRCF